MARGPGLVAAALALALAAAAGAAPGDGGHAPEPGRAPPQGCDEPTFACAREATPVFAPDGSLWVAWSTAGRVYAARSTDGGASFDAPREATRGPARLDHAADARPQVVAGADGSVTVGWAVMTEVQFKGELWHARAPGVAAPFAAPRPVHDSPGGKRFLALARAADGRVLAAWVDKDALEAAQAAGREYAGADVVAAWSEDGGASFGEPFRVQAHTCECCRVAVAFDAAARPVILWRNLYGRARDHAIATLTGPRTVGPAHRVSRDDWEIDACPHHGPAVAVGEGGSYHVAWFTASATRSGLFYARSTDAGASFGAPLSLGDPARQPARPQLLALGGRLWLAWREYDGAATHAVVMSSRDDGRSWSAPRALARTAGTADHPLLVGDGRRAWLSWLTRDEGYRLLPLDADG